MDALQRLIAQHDIADVIGRYCMLFDDQEWDGLAELWTVDAAFIVEDKAFEGRDTLLDFLRNCLPPGFQSKHMIAPPIIDLADDGLSATARTDVVWISGNFENTIVARYHDDLVSEDGRWRFRRRLEIPMQYTPGAPPMSEAATGVSGATMRSATS
jgi:SnoaL-like domain